MSAGSFVSKAAVTLLIKLPKTELLFAFQRLFEIIIQILGCVLQIVNGRRV